MPRRWRDTLRFGTAPMKLLLLIANKWNNSVLRGEIQAAALTALVCMIRFAQQFIQRGETFIYDFGLTVARAFVQVLATLRAQSLARFAAAWRWRHVEQRIFP